MIEIHLISLRINSAEKVKSIKEVEGLRKKILNLSLSTINTSRKIGIIKSPKEELILT